MGDLFLSFSVSGIPRPKQSFQKKDGGGGYTPRVTKDWQDNVGWEAKQQMMGKSPHSGPVAAEFLFTLPESKVRKDLDNLIKGTMDGMKNIVFVDDDQVMRLQAEKRYTKNRKIIEPGVHIVVRSITE